MTSVLDLLKEDAKYRHLGVSDDLFTLHDISSDSSWSYDLPTITRYADYARKKIQKNNDEFKKTFYTILPFLNNINLENLLIAGGSIRSILLNTGINDVDLFLYGIGTIEEGQTRIEKFIIDIYTNLYNLKNGVYIQKEILEHNKIMKSADTNSQYRISQEFNKKYADKYQPNINMNISVYSNGNTITLFVNNVKIQLILRLYNTVSEILHGFDLGSSAVGFDGANVYFTSLSKFSFENMVNIIDCTRRSTTYENRLIKYFDSGFSIVLPNIDMKKLKTNYHKYNLSEVCELPFMTFSYTDIIGNSIRLNKFHTQAGNDVITDYDFYGSLNSADGESKYMLLRYNLTELIKGKNRFVIRIDLNEEISILQSKGLEPKSWKLNFNKQFVDVAFIEWNYNKLMMDILNNDKILIDKIRKYINVVDVKEFVNEIYLSDLSKDIRASKISDVINRQKNKVKQDFASLETKFALNWITETPSTQLTSSINPIIEDNSQWYGEYYLNDDDLAAKLEENKSSVICTVPKVDIVTRHVFETEEEAEEEAEEDADAEKDDGEDGEEDDEEDDEETEDIYLIKKAHATKKSHALIAPIIPQVSDYERKSKSKIVIKR
jgi:hypothetical protein